MDAHLCLRLRSLRRWAGLFLVVGGLASSPAVAQGGPLPEGEAWSFLEAQNNELKQAYDRLPKRYGVDAQAENEAIDEAEAAVRQVVGRLTGRHRSADEAFSTMQKNIARLNEQIRVARFAQAATEAHRTIVTQHQQEQPAEAPLLDELDARVNALAQEGGRGWQPVIEFFQSAAAGHRTKAEQLRVSAAKRLEEQRAEKERAALDAAMREANLLRRTVEDPLTAGVAAPEDALQALQVAANKVASVDLGAGRYYLYELRLVKLASALLHRDRDQAAADAATVLEGGLLRSGRTKSSSLKVSFRAKESWCYALVLRFAGPSAGEVSELSFDARGKDALQRFVIPQLVPGWQRLEGVCTLGRGRVTARAKVDNEGSPLRYVVVGWPRADVPKGLFAHAEVRPTDRCDFDTWQSYWMNPVPGTLVQRGGRPYLVSQASAVGQSELRLLDVAGNSAEADKAELAQPAPSEPPAWPRYEFTGCAPAELASHKRSRILAACYERVERRHARAIRRAERRKDRAGSDEEEAEADKALQGALQAEDDDRARTCGSKERRIAEAGRRAHDRLVEKLEAGGAKTSIDRARVILDEENARPELR